MMATVTERRIKCGSCHDRHETVAQVRLCYENKARGQDGERKHDAASCRVPCSSLTPRQQREYEDDERAYASKPDAVLFSSEEDEAAARLDLMTGSHGRDMASPKQVAYVMDLLAQHVWPDPLTQPDVENMERRQVSKLIDGLLSSPRKSRENQPSPIPGVPAGRYALRNEEDGDIRFFQVDRPTEGRWAGRTFLNRLIGAPGDYRKDPTRGMGAARILNLIAADPEASAILYGRESKECGVCHSALSNKASRDRGIGPVCAAKTGWGS